MKKLLAALVLTFASIVLTVSLGIIGFILSIIMVASVSKTLEAEIKAEKEEKRHQELLEIARGKK